jgi:hypothetical protein
MALLIAGTHHASTQRLRCSVVCGARLLAAAALIARRELQWPF